MQRRVWAAMAAVVMVSGCSGQASTANDVTPSASATTSPAAPAGEEPSDAASEMPASVAVPPSTSLQADGQLRATADGVGVFDGSGPDTPTVAWEFDTGAEVRATPIRVGDTVYVGSVSGTFHALDAESGDQRWSFETGGEIVSSAAVAGELVVFVSKDGEAYALDTATGEQVWHMSVAPPSQPGTQEWFYVGSSPVVADGRVFIGGRGDRGSLYALDVATGDVLWVLDGDDIGVRAPVAVADGVVYVPTGYFALAAVDVETGATLWTAPIGDSMSAPAVVDGTVFVGSRDATLQALSAETGEQLWVHRDPLSSWMDSGPAVVDGVVYVGGSDNHQVTALDAETGDVVWTASTDGVNPLTSIAVAGDTVFASAGDAYLEHTEGHLFAYDRATGEERWRFTRENFWSSPFVAGSMLYVGNDDGKVYALGATG